MVRRSVVVLSVLAGAAVAAGVATLIWWLVTRGDDEVPRFETIPLEGEGFGGVQHRAAFTKIPGSGEMFWWFYPTLAEGPETRPLVLWLDGVVGLPPSLLANFGMLGPFDLSLNRRNDSWVNEFNLLFVDAPLGSGFSTIVGDASANTANTVDDLLLTLESFYDHNEGYENAPLFIFGQGYGGNLALSLALALEEAEHMSPNLKGVVLGNTIISPGLTITKLGFYLEEMGYIDANGRSAIEHYTDSTYDLVNKGEYDQAFDKFMALGQFVNEDAGAVAINLWNIVEKMTKVSGDILAQHKYLSGVVGYNGVIENFMNGVVASALGITNPKFEVGREDIQQAFKKIFMAPAVDKIEKILNNAESDVTVTIYNGNLDAISNTPGQLEWINNLQWPGQSAFLNSTRVPLVLNGLLEGHFRETDKLTFYWMNSAGLSVPMDSPAAMRRIAQRIMNE